MSIRVTGTFEVTMAPQPPSDRAVAASLGRMTLDKRYQGPLAGSAAGEMLACMTETKGSAVYVAMERFRGTLDGRAGSFALHHTGIMDRGAQSLSVRVVPDSGTEQLAGIAGTLIIRIEGGQHFYDFDYTLP